MFERVFCFTFKPESYKHQMFGIYRMFPRSYAFIRKLEVDIGQVEEQSSMVNTAFIS